MDYYDRLQTGMEPIVRTILRQQFAEYDEDWSPTTIAAALHFYLFHKLPYEKRHENGTRPFRSPQEAWKRGGNCQEKTVALASLYDSVRAIDTRMLSVTNSDGDAHLLAELGVDAPRSEVVAELDSFYADLRDTYELPSRRSYYTTADGDRTWFLTDPEMSRFVGDDDALRRQRFISVRPGIDDWREVNYYVYPTVGRVSEPVDADSI